MADQRVVIVGAGPAGVRAAQTLVAGGVRPVIVDENARDGGQIYRRQPDSLKRPYRLIYGTEADRAANVHAAFENLRSNVDYRPQTLAWNIVGRCLHLVKGSLSSTLEFDALIIASGATDRLLPVRGWNLAGVYSLGAAQIALKSQACAIGRKVAFLGTGPLLYLVATQYLKYGADVVGVFDTSAMSRRLRALPSLIERPATLGKGIALMAILRRHGIPIKTGVKPMEITGGPEHGVQSLTVRTRGSATLTVQCDAVALGYHLRAEAALADLAHCEFYFDRVSRQWLPVVDIDGRATVKGIYLAGDGARLAGADGAEIAGELVALSVLNDFGRTVEMTRVSRLRKELSRMERFRSGLAKAFPWPFEAAAGISDDTVVCRCEVITAGEIRKLAAQNEATEINRNKAFGRAGMGRCQGRYCGHATAEIIAAATATPIEQVGRLRGQAPVKPISIGTVADRNAR